MNSTRWSVFFGLAAVLALAPAALAQSTPRIAYVYPAGGQRGATFQVTLGGRFLTGVTNAFISGKGVQAKVLEFNKPMGNREFLLFQDQLSEMAEKRQAALESSRARAGKGKAPQNDAPQFFTNATWTVEEERLMAKIKADIKKNPPNNGDPPRIPHALAETVTLEVKVAPDAEPGEREIRLGSVQWLTNPLVFCIDQPLEVTEGKENNEEQPGGRRLARYRPPPGTVMKEAEWRIAPPTIINGRIMPGDADRFRFTALKGQKLVISAAARRLIPYLADAVPGWFQATLELFDAKGKELAYDDDYLFSPDPVILFDVPAFGEYTIEIKDAIYRGREDFIYRITLGELPFVTSMFPLGGPAGAQTTVELKGWNLPASRLTVDNRNRTPGNYPIIVNKDKWVSNEMPFAVDTLPECLDKEPNNSQGQAQPVTLPIIVNGRIDKPDDTDVFRFEGRAGQQIVAEILARRLNSPVDSVLTLTDAAGKQLAANDDYEDKGSGMNTHHADSYLSVSLPANGTYFLKLADTQHKGGAECGYRLRLGPPRPDFDLRLVPSSVSVRPGGSAAVTVYALRKDGFAGEIALALKDTPPGFGLSGQVPAGQEKAQVTLTAPSNSQEQLVTINVEGRAKIDGRQVAHMAVPAEDRMQAFLWRHLLPSKQLEMAIAGRPASAPKPSVRLLGQMPVRIPAGGTIKVQFATPSGSFSARPRLQLNNAPEGIGIKNVSSSREGVVIELQSDAKVKPGLKGSLVVTALADSTGPAGQGKAKGNPTAQASLPAIPFEIVRQ